MIFCVRAGARRPPSCEIVDYFQHDVNLVTNGVAGRSRSALLHLLCRMVTSLWRWAAQTGRDEIAHDEIRSATVEGMDILMGVPR
jgi:hypothetical protein